MSPVDNKQVIGASGSGTFTIKAGFRMIAFVATLKTGTQGTIKLGTTAGGNDIERGRVINSTDPHKDIARNWSEPQETSWTIYWEITGTGATFNLYVDTIIYTQQ